MASTHPFFILLQVLPSTELNDCEKISSPNKCSHINVNGPLPPSSGDKQYRTLTICVCPEIPDCSWFMQERTLLWEWLERGSNLTSAIDNHYVNLRVHMASGFSVFSSEKVMCLINWFDPVVDRLRAASMVTPSWDTEQLGPRNRFYLVIKHHAPSNEINWHHVSGEPSRRPPHVIFLLEFLKFKSNHKRKITHLKTEDFFWKRKKKKTPILGSENFSILKKSMWENFISKRDFKKPRELKVIYHPWLGPRSRRSIA